MKSHRETSIRDEQRDSCRETSAARLLPAVTFGARAAVLAGVVATACATAAPAVSAAAATHAPATVTLHGPGGGFVTPADSTCCM